ncbi:hypothetical protein F5Y16DRAFT_379730 [Xylariaceae sp. FL0255]|nr:hypothetical protein F5Y16DRAFT_379730 [Xylariaceae sp. FL0255]
MRNTFMGSKFKILCSAALFFSSVPIHLLFNSVIFETESRESNFHLTIASDEFLTGGDYFPPGASLTIPGQNYTTADVPLRLATSTISLTPQPTAYFSNVPEPIGGVGVGIGIPDYHNNQSQAVLNVAYAASNAGEWTNLTTKECWNQYANCHGLQEYSDVVLVLDQPGGWLRTDIWNLTRNQSLSWESFVPTNSSNSLFFDAPCMMQAIQEAESIACVNSCDSSLGANSNLTPATGLWQYNFFAASRVGTAPSAPGVWYEGSSYGTTNGTSPDNFNVEYLYGGLGNLVGDNDLLTVKYCMAKPAESSCRIALSPTLLLAATLCVIAKTIAAIVVTAVLANPTKSPLVTLGDAIASFIEHPDVTTAGLCTVGQEDVRRVMNSRHTIIQPGPRQWFPLRSRRAAAVPKSVWATSYLFFLSCIAILAFLFHLAVAQGFSGTFLESDSDSFINLIFSLTGAVLLANSPQIFLAIWYLTFNNLLTRLQLAREWSKLSEGYHPLRVTDPKGAQFSTYRLQLPYGYSLPLLFLSIGLHWLFSNSIFAFVSSGSYYIGRDMSTINEPGLPSNTIATVGYSAPSVLLVLVLAVVLILIPPILSLNRLPEGSIITGTNSLAISAACHSLTRPLDARGGGKSLNGSCSDPSSIMSDAGLSRNSDERNKVDQVARKRENEIVLTRRPDTRNNKRFSQSSRYVALSGTEERLDSIELDSWDLKGNRNQLRELARSRIRWGVIPMPKEWYEEYNGYDFDNRVEHLGFGVESDMVGRPLPGHYYA